MRRAIQLALLGGLLGGLLAVPACELGNGTLVVPSDAISVDAGRMAVSFDGDVVWLDSGQPLFPGGPMNFEDRQLTAVSAIDGEVLLEKAPFADAFNIQDLTTAFEAGFEGGAWVLHANGFRTRWDVGGQLTAFEPPVPSAEFPADARSYCGMARGLDGAAYMTTGDVNGVYTTYYLYRYDQGSFSRIMLSANKCPDVDYDVALQEVAVKVPYDGVTHDVLWLDPDTLVQTHNIEIPALDGDFVAFDHNVAVATGSSVRLYDDQGVQTDSDHSVHPVALDAQYGDNMVRLWWAGVDQTYDFSAGWLSLQ